MLDNFTNENTALPEVVEQLKFRLGMSKFKLANSRFLGFRWKISTKRGNIALKVLIAKSLDDIPIIVLERPERYHPLPHIMSTGEICYIDRTAFVFNQFDPVGQTLFCINRAKDVIEEIFDDGYKSDLETEFFAYWHHSWHATKEKLIALVDISETSLRRKLTCFSSKINKTHFFFTNDEINLIQKWPSKLRRFQDAFLLITEQKLKATAPWPPLKGYQLIEWFRQIDQSLKRQFEKMASPKRSDKFKLFVLKSPQGFFAFVTYFKPMENKFLNSTERLYDADINFMTTSRIDKEYVCMRNIPSIQNLKDKKIALVGCGSIGSFLADMLVKLGAGTGTGLITIIDNDKFEAGNIGRHRLGYPSIEKSKAKELRNEILRMMPANVVESMEKNAKGLTIQDLEQFDLIIDATGEESIGNHLCSVLKEKALLSVWVEGNGVAVRGLLRTNVKQACYHCIRQYEMENRLLAVKSGGSLVLKGSCRSPYVTYPITAAVQAACLGADMVLNWANGKFEPSLRTRLIDSDSELGSSDCTPDPHHNCRLCNPCI